MNKRVTAAVSLAILLCSAVSFAVWINTSKSPSGVDAAEQSHAEAMEDLADQYANAFSTFPEVLQEIDNKTLNNQLTPEEADWLKVRVAELRSAASSQQGLNQPETFEAYTGYFVSYGSQVLSDIRTAQQLYDQYSRNPASNGSITQGILQTLNQARLKEASNLVLIDAEINQLILNGTLTNSEGALLREHVHEARAP